MECGHGLSNPDRPCFGKLLQLAVQRAGRRSSESRDFPHMETAVITRHGGERIRACPSTWRTLRRTYVTKSR